METLDTITATNKLDPKANFFMSKNVNNPLATITVFIKLDNSEAAQFLASKYNLRKDRVLLTAKFTRNEILDLQQEECVISITSATKLSYK